MNPKCLVTHSVDLGQDSMEQFLVGGGGSNVCKYVEICTQNPAWDVSIHFWRGF